MKTVLRVTRHSAITAEQASALQAAVTKLCSEEGPHTVIVHGQTVQNAQEVLNLAIQHGAAVVEAVLPPAILAELTNPRVNTQGILVIRAKMDRQMDETTKEATFTFASYERIVKVEVVTEQL